MRAWVSGSCSRSSASWPSIESNACAGLVPRVVADLARPSAPARCGPGAVTASLSRAAPTTGARSPSTSANVSGLSTSQPVQLVHGEVDQAVVQVVAHDLGEQAAGQRRDRLLAEARDERLGDEVGDVLVADLAQPDRGDLGDLVDHPAHVARARRATVPTRSEMARRRDPLADDRPPGGSSPPRTPRGSRPSSSLRRGISAVCGTGRPSGCLNSAVTANQSAIAPTIDASAPALTKPEEAVAGRGSRGTPRAANTSSDTASVRIRRRPAGGARRRRGRA